ncbi:T-cell surface antigen CD2 isoform X1 [Notechis scutatus]|uniref:T-cell surface antigen CD2 isoform X1 n=1 Tax=Notechis scutatus TaxID=8663 RepID=A0A6J1TT63_9SAUR|nr:T-cell surface antigen CD2 isoform X1 [Notechis scutatus]
MVSYAPLSLLINTALNMNLDKPFLIKFLMILFSLEGPVSMNDKIHGGSVSMNDKIHGRTGNQIILSAPKHSTKPFYLIWTKNSTFIADYSDNSITLSTKQPEPNKYYLFLNGSLKINRLRKMDAGNYEVEAYTETGKHLFHGLITLQVDELQPKLNELCPQKTLTCEVKYSEKPKPRFKLFQDTKEIETLEPVYDNATWKVTLQLKVHSGKFRCEIDVNSEKYHIEKQITCSGEDLLDSGTMFIILMITGSVVTSIIFLALIVYCIRRKKVKRCEREAEEYALQIQINNHLQKRKLPEVPVSSGSNPSSQKNNPPPSQRQQQIGPSKSCSHPKPPRRIKQRP